jgi:carbon storage regulator
VKIVVKALANGPAKGMGHCGHWTFFSQQLFYQPRECAMLVLTRKQNEKVRIGNEITITVLRTKGKAVRLGIEAPAHINVLRGELVFELPPDDLENKTTGADIAEKPVPSKAAKVSGLRQQPATIWPTSPTNRTDTSLPGTARKPDLSQAEGPLRGLAKSHWTKC